MGREMSEATEALLESFEADLQRQLGRSAAVERLVLRPQRDGRVTLVATIRVSTSHEIIGNGENLVTAYANLTHAAPELVLAMAYRQVLEQSLDA